jgi:hypothetical protein
MRRSGSRNRENSNRELLRAKGERAEQRYARDLRRRHCGDEVENETDGAGDEL